MVELVAVKSLDTHIKLKMLYDNVYMSVNNFYSASLFLQQGCRIWIKYDTYYAVYRIRTSWDSGSESKEEYLDRIIEFIQSGGN